MHRQMRCSGNEVCTDEYIGESVDAVFTQGGPTDLGRAPVEPYDISVRHTVQHAFPAVRHTVQHAFPAARGFSKHEEKFCPSCSRSSQSHRQRFPADESSIVVFRGTMSVRPIFHCFGNLSRNSRERFHMQIALTTRGEVNSGNVLRMRDLRYHIRIRGKSRARSVTHF